MACARARSRIPASATSLNTRTTSAGTGLKIRTSRAIVGAGLLGGIATTSGIALTATSGWLIVRASQRPPILLLLTAIVAVRAFGMARPAFRYWERLRSHDAALADLADRRTTAYRRLIPLTPARLGRRGRADLLTGVVDDLSDVVDAQVRVTVPVVAALVASTVTTIALAILSTVAGLVIAAMTILTEAVLLAQNVYFVRKTIGHVPMPGGLIRISFVFAFLMIVGLFLQRSVGTVAVGLGVVAVFAVFLCLTIGRELLSRTETGPTC